MGNPRLFMYSSKEREFGRADIYIMVTLARFSPSGREAFQLPCLKYA